MASEKYNFAQTCNLFSQYLKEKRAPTTPQVPTTMNLLTNLEINKSVSDQAAPTKKPNIDLFPQIVKNPEAMLQDQRPGSAAQMTIFYGGQVLIFNEIQSEKAREIMGLATKGGSKVCAGFVAPPESKIVSANSHKNIQKMQPQAVVGSDLPIARRSSLHKFLAKRKERVAALAPYQVNYYASPAKSDEQMSSMDQVEGQSSQHLELRL